MVNIVSVNNEEKTVYTVPTGKTLMGFVDVYPVVGEPSCVLKINDYVYWSGMLFGMVSVKVVLTEGDVVKVSTDGQVNVFVHGII